MSKDNAPRMRAEPLAKPPRIVLLEPEIPQNTGNIGRISAALQCPLHLIEPLGFRTDEKAVRRAGLDYWPLVEMHQHPSLEHFREQHPHSRLRFFSAVGKRCYLDAQFSPGDALVFGKESTGLPDELLASNADETYALPTIGQVRSMNLANTVGIVVYEAFRQLGAFERLSFRP